MSKGKITLHHGTVSYLDESGQIVNKFGEVFDAKQTGLAPSFGIVWLTPEMWEALNYATPKLAYSSPRRPGLTLSEEVIYEIEPPNLSMKVIREFNNGRRHWDKGPIPREWITGKYVVVDSEAVSRAREARLPLNEIKGIAYRPL